MNGIEILGWIANGVVLIQFLHSDMFKLRIWGIIGATLWGIYGIMIESYPLISMNVLIWLIQAYHLRKLSIEKKGKNRNDKKTFERP